MTRIRPLIVLLLILLPLVGIQAQDLPPQFALALNSLGSRLDRPLTVNNLDNWQFEQNIYPDTALGCSYVFGTLRPEGISGYKFTMVYQGVSYDYRVSTDGSIVFPCIPDGGGQAPAQPTSQATNCPADFAGYLPPKLTVNGQGRIGAGGTPNRLRDAPSVNANQIGLIQPNSTVNVLAGPVCEDSSHIIWWRVDNNGTVGWTAEGMLPGDYFLSPIASTLPAERSLIAVDNVSTLAPLTTISLAGVSSVSFTEDTRLIALGGLSGLAVYDLATLTLNTQLGDISAPVLAVAFSPDGRYLAYAKQDGTLQVVDTSSGTRSTLPRASSERIDTLAFSGQNDLLASGSGAPAGGTPSSWQIFDLPNNRQMINVPTSSWVRSVAFSLDNTQFAWLDTSLHVVQMANGANVRTSALQQPAPGQVAWRPTSFGSPATHSVAFTDGALVRLTNLDTNVEQTYSGDPNFFPASIAFSHDGSLLAAMNIPNNTATASTVNIFDTDTSDLITSTPFQASSALVFSPDGTLLVIASNDEVVMLGVNSSDLAAG